MESFVGVDWDNRRRMHSANPLRYQQPAQRCIYLGLRVRFIVQGSLYCQFIKEKGTIMCLTLFGFADHEQKCVSSDSIDLRG